MIYVYAITARRCPHTDDLRGVEHQPVVARETGELAVACSEHARSTVDPSADRLWRHESVVEALLQSCDAVLPVRFGMTFNDEAALDDALSRHEQALVAGLDRVRGCVEVGLRVTQRKAQPVAPPAPEAVHSSGRAYMLARLENERRRRGAEADAKRMADAVQAAVSPPARDAAHRILPAPNVLLSSAYLVGRDEADALIARVRDLAPQYPDLRLLCTGPWPPYHFAPSLRREEPIHA